MKLTEVRVGAARTLNLGNYESLRIEAGATVAIEDGDDMAAVKAALQVELRGLLEETYRAQHRPKAEPKAEPKTAPGQAKAPAQQPGAFKPAEPAVVADEPTEY